MIDLKERYNLSKTDLDTYAKCIDSIIAKLVFSGMSVDMKGFFEVKYSKTVNKKAVARNKHYWRNILKENKNFYLAPENERRCIKPKKYEPKQIQDKPKHRAPRKTELVPWGINMGTKRRPA